MAKKLLNIGLCLLGLIGFLTRSQAQCEVFDQTNNIVPDPMWLACSGTDYTLNIYSPNDWTNYTIDWGDGSALETGSNWMANTILSHFYPLTVQNFTIVITNTDLGCSITGTLVMEEPTAAVVSPATAAITTACAPHTIDFENSSFDVSENTVFTYDFGDGSGLLTFDHTNAGQIISHTYEENTVDCNTQILLTAENFCNAAQNSPSESTWGPIQIYDVDDASIAASTTTLCFPDNTVTYTNSTERNCYNEGNDESLAPRYEYWNFGDYWGLGHDSIVDWTIWPPINPYTIQYPGGVGATYEVMMIDSSYCGLDTAYQTINIISPPSVTITTDPLVCAGEAFTIDQEVIGATGINNNDLENVWDLGNGTAPIPLPLNDITYVYSSPGTYTITNTIGVANSPACGDVATVTIEVLAIPDVTILADNTSGCGDVDVNFSETSTNADNWDWDLGNGNTYNGTSPPTQTYNTPGDHPVTVVASNAAGCESSDIQIISVFNEPVVDFIAENVCEGTDAQFTDLSTSDGGDPIIMWDWDFGDTNTSIDQHPVHQYGPPGTYNATLEVSTLNCNASVTIPLTVESAPEPIFAPDFTNGCAPLDVTFTNNSINSDSYTWDFGDQAGSFAESPEHTFYNFTNSDTVYNVVMTAFSNFGCYQKDSVQINVSPGAQASFTHNAQPPGCAPFLAVFTNTSYGGTNYLWDFGDGSPTSTLENPTHVYNNNTGFIQTYDIDLIAYSPNGCNDTITSTITVFPEPDFTFDVTPNNGCTPLVVSMPLVASGQSFNWDFGDGQSSTIPNPTHLYENNTTDPVTYTVTLNAVSAFGCAGTDSSHVTVFPSPVADFNVSTFSGCSPLELEIYDNSSGATSGTFDFGDNQTQPYATGVTTHTYENNTGSIQTYDILLDLTNAQGCTNQHALSVEVSPSANAEIISPPNGCAPYNTTFLNNSTNSTGFQWDFGNGLTSAQNNGTTTFFNNSGTDTTYTVSLTAMSAFGCDDVATTDVVVYSSPSASFTADVTSGCSVVSIEFTNNSMGANTYHWDYGDGTDSDTGLNNHFHDFENLTDLPVEYMVTLTVSNAIGCTDSYQLPVTVFPQITAEFEQEENGCSPLVVSFDNESFGSQTDFSWDFGDGNTSTQSNPVHSFINNSLNDTTFTVELFTTSVYGCQDTYTQDITVYGTPQAVLNVDDTEGCYPLDVTFGNQSLGADSYLWVYGTGEVGNNSDPQHTHTFYNLDQTPVNYVVTLNAYSIHGCESSDNTVIEVQPQLIADFESETTGCTPLTIQFENQSTGALNHEWDFGDGSDVSTELHPNHIFENNTNETVIYTVMLVSESYVGCTDTAYTDITVYPLPTAIFDATPISQTFPNTTVFIDNQSLGGADVNYTWNFGDDTDLNFSNEPASHTYETWGVYSINLFADNGFCSHETTTEIEIIPPPPVARFEGPAKGCAPLTVQFTNTSEYTLSYLWDFGDGGFAQVSDPSYTFQNPGTYSVKLIATGYNNGETDELIREEIIVVHPRAVPAFAVTPTEVSIPSQAVLLFNISQNASEFEWDFGDGNSSTEESPEHFYQQEGVYDITLYANNEFNCPDSLTQYAAVTASAIGSIEFPNAFTPVGNSGGDYDPNSFDNDVFFPVQTGVQDYQLHIFNKWGELLFESKDVFVGWDGTYRGELVKQDVYVWKVKVKFSDGTELTRAGDVTLLR